MSQARYYFSNLQKAVAESLSVLWERWALDGRCVAHTFGDSDDLMPVFAAIVTTPKTGWKQRINSPWEGDIGENSAVLRT